MAQFRIRVVRISVSVLLTLIVETAYSADSWTGFVPPVSTNVGPDSIVYANDQKEYRWRTGRGFNTSGQHEFIQASVHDIKTRDYALTPPQKKSVNPWAVNRFSVNDFTKNHTGFGPAKRPWGKVPEQYSKGRTYNANQKKNYSVQQAMNMFSLPRQIFRPYLNNNVLNNPDLLFPPGGDISFYSVPYYMNLQAFSTGRHAYSGAYLWR